MMYARAGASLAAAVLLPNVEFIFGLSGSTAAALLAFVFPAWTFLLAATPVRTAARPDLDLSPCMPLWSSWKISPLHTRQLCFSCRQSNQTLHWQLCKLGGMQWASWNAASIS